MNHLASLSMFSALQIVYSSIANTGENLECEVRSRSFSTVLSSSVLRASLQRNQMPGLATDSSAIGARLHRNM